jgi:hypothetical protein
MTKNPGQLFRSDATTAEKLEALFNEQKLRKAQGRTKDASTLHARAVTDADEVRGRFAQHEKSEVIGATQAVEYPRLPSGPWADPVQIPPEEPLGYDINETPIVGESFEIEASLAAVDAPLAVGASSADVRAPAAIPTPKLKGRSP